MPLESIETPYPKGGSIPKDGCPQSSSTITSTLGLPEAISPNEKVDSVPDGGLRAWLVVFGAWCGLFCSLGWLNSTFGAFPPLPVTMNQAYRAGIGTFQSYYQTTLLRQYSASTISWIPSFEIFFTFVMSPVIGRLYDSFGPRYVILGGSILHVFGLMMASISTKYYQLLLSQGVCSALGICAIFQPCMSSIPSWFQHKRGAAYGIASSGTSLGGVIFPIMISQLIRRVGYAWSMRISAFLLLFLLTIVNLTVKSRAPSQRQKISKDTLLQPFREVPMVLLLLGFFFLTFGVFIPINYIVIQAIDDGMSNDLAQYLTALLNAASLFGRLSAGILSDKIGTYNILVSACYFAGILSLALWIPATSNAGIIVFAILFGFASGAYIALAAALVVRICPFKEIGYRTGLLFLVASVSGLAASPIGGAIVHCEGGSYIGMQIFSGVTLLLGSSFVLAARFSKTGLVLWTRF